jgi:hypothetical protein
MRLSEATCFPPSSAMPSIAIHLTIVVVQLVLPMLRSSMRQCPQYQGAGASLSCWCVRLLDAEHVVVVLWWPGVAQPSAGDHDAQRVPHSSRRGRW